VAGPFGGEVFGFEDLPQALVRADIVIASTGAPRFVLRRDVMCQAMRQRRGRLLFLIDIAVPRDVEPEVGETEAGHGPGQGTSPPRRPLMSPAEF
jgi:glutamyl-tRNA reductase